MIYRLEFEDVVSLANTADYGIFKIWKNPEPIQAWQSIPLKSSNPASLPDVIGLRSIMVWQLALVEVIPSDDYQALPVTLDDMTCYAIHITRVLDCLDAKRSIFKRFKNRNIGVEHYVLRANCVGDALLFTIPDDGHSAIFASETFKSQVEEERWTGLSFFPVEMSE